MSGHPEEPAQESPPQDRLIAHVDMDAFFVSVERMDRPDLENQPVIVGGSTGRRGVVSAASYEARAFGVHSAMPMARARELCPHAVYIQANHKKYGEASGRVMRVLGDFTPAVQAVSVDEAYLDLSGTERLHGPPLQTAARIREAVLRETNCSASIGLASSRLVSKIASGLSKPAGILRIYPGGEAAFLRPLEVSKIPGVGKVMVEKLNRLGISTVGDLGNQTLPFLEAQFKNLGPELYRKARGLDDSELELENRPKSIGKETTFTEDTADLAKLEAILTGLAEEASARVRRKGLSARHITLKLRFSDFTTLTRSFTLEKPTHLDKEIIEPALDLLRRTYNKEGRNQKFRLLGVYLSGLNAARAQPQLFEDAGREKEERLVESLDRIRERFGHEAVFSRKSVERIKKT